MIVCNPLSFVFVSSVSPVFLYSPVVSDRWSYTSCLPRVSMNLLFAIRSTRHPAGIRRFQMSLTFIFVSFCFASAALLQCCCLPCVLLFCSSRCCSACSADSMIAASCVICTGPLVGLCRLRPGRPPGPSFRAGSPVPPRSLPLFRGQ